MYRRIFLGATVTAVLSLTLPAMTIAASPSAVTPSEAPVILPAGTQYSGAIEGLPRKLPVTGMTDKLIASHDGVVVALGSDGLRVQAGIRDRDGHWDLAQVDRSGRVKAPKGLRSGLGIGPSAVAGGPNGFVAVGDTAFTNGTTKFGLVPLIWHSSDGHTWKRFDARKIMGANLSGDLNTVIATEQGGFLAAGSVAPLGLRGRSTIVIIGSPDGVDWRQLGTIDGTWSLAADRLLIVGDSLVLVGTEYACGTTADHQENAMTGGQTRAWRSQDGQTWSPIGLGDSGVIVAAEPAPPNAKGCPKGKGYDAFIELNDRFRTSGTIAGSAGGALVAVDATTSRVATSTDLSTWMVVDLPGATPGGDVPGYRNVADVRVVQGTSGEPVLLSVEARRENDDRVTNRGQQVLAWQTTDGGVSWDRLPATRPMILRGDAFLTSLGDGSVGLFDVPRPGRANTPATARLGVEGSLETWQTCTPAASADCSFATLTDLDVADQDLSGIDLTGATVRGGHWTGVTLAGAHLSMATLETSLANADLSRATVEAADLIGADLTGADLTDTRLTGSRMGLVHLAQVPTTTDMRGTIIIVPDVPVPDVQFQGRDLRDARIWGNNNIPAGLAGADFGGARLDRVNFYGLDLTGASFKGARITDSTFASPVVCPDGKPMRDGAVGPAACRIKVR